MHGLATELAEARRKTPTDDLMLGLVHSTLDGERLTDLVIASIFLLFAVAGNDTTRNSTAHGIKAFSDNPQRWALFRLAEPIAGVGA